MAAAGAAVALAIVAVSALALQSSLQPEAPSAGRIEAATLAAADAQGVLDSDRDGLSDARETYIHGTDPRSASTTGAGIPDGWLVRYGFDPLDPTIAHHRGATPPASALPAAYRGVWPDAFAATLHDLYAHGRPAAWNESAQGPHDSRLDPREWDNNGDGIPDGFLLHYGLDPLRKDLATQRLAGPDGLTVREAFQHATDPRRLDSDGDGIPDGEEVAGPSNPLSSDGARFAPTDPARHDTNGGGACDGYLRSHGLDPNLPESTYGDPDTDGATTQQEHAWSRQRFGNQTCLAGAGLDPRRQATAGLPIPDGWLLRYGLDPLDAAAAGRITERAATSPGPPVASVGNVTVPDDLSLTVLDEYAYGRPAAWNESRDGPWWGGTDPALNDTDGDGLGDAWEMRGYAVSASSDPVQPQPKAYLTHSNPTAPDTDGDGLGDGQEANPALRAPPTGPVTDARRKDTDFDQLADGEELAGNYGLDPTRADSIGDLLPDGERLRMLVARAGFYAKDPPYEHPGLPDAGRKAAASFAMAKAAKGAALAPDALAQLVGPTGDMDVDGVPNVLDKDMDGDNLLNGWEARPTLYAASSFGPSPFREDGRRSATDPLNPDTDGDLLPDGWEVEHGKPDTTIPGFNMDPALWDSDRDGADDGQEDPDHDSVTWFSVKPDGARQDNLFPFPNRQEYLATTNPNLASSDGDGLGDGWKYFWGQAYVSQAVPCGAVCPAFLGGGALPSVVPQLGQRQSPDDAALVQVRYDRWVPAGDGQAPDGLLPAERVVLPPERLTVTDRNQATHTLVHTHGTLRFTLFDARRLGTNPYLAADPRSSDGDRLPDWWEDLMGKPLPGLPVGQSAWGGCVAGPGPDATQPDGDEDADQDGLDTAHEFLALPPTLPSWHGPSPLCRDSDLGGLPDGQEATPFAAGDPTDDGGNGPTQDSDGDDVPDAQELVRATDPFDPDTDGDGLLDGRNVGPLRLDAADAVQRAQAHLLLDLGVAYRTQPNDPGSFTFLGEQALSLDPTNPDDSGAGIPAGWLAAHGLPTKPSDPSSLAGCSSYYHFARPAWWQEERHGPWWGGIVAHAKPTYGSDCPAPGPRHTGLEDLDGDGLFDVDDNLDPYEDLQPWAMHGNRLPAFPYGRYQATLAARNPDHPLFADPGLPDPPDPASASDPGVDALVRRLLAQSAFTPHKASTGAGSDYLDRDLAQWGSNPPRQPVCIVLDNAADAATIDKGKEVVLRGRAVDTCGAANPSGIAGLTVEARMDDSLHPDSGDPRHKGQQLFGAAFTAADGSFAVRFNLTANHAVDNPDGHVLRGSTDPAISWVADPAVVVPGPGRPILLRTYATPTHSPALHLIPAATVRSAPVLSWASVPDSVTAGAEVTLAARLTDTGGSPLSSPVEFTFPDGQPATATPNPDGIAEAKRTLDGAAHGLRPAAATASTALGKASLSHNVRLQRPSTLALAVPPSADAGTVAVVTGTLTTQGEGVPEVPVTVQVAGAGQGPPIQATTDAAGGFTAIVPLAPGAPFGTYTVSATAAATDSVLAAEASDVLRVRAAPVLDAVTQAPIWVGQPFWVAGRLAEPDGRAGVPNATVQVSVGPLRQPATTDAHGRFNATLEGDLPVLPALQEVSFAGDGRHAAARHQHERAVSSPTRLETGDQVLARGAVAHVTVRLLDGIGRPIPGALVTLQWGQEDPHGLLTRGDGIAAWDRPPSPGDALGTITLRAHYAGSADGASGAAAATATWSIQAIAEFALPQGNFTAGDRLPLGVLRDAGTGLPLPHAPVLLRIGEAGVAQREVRAETDAAGRFPLLDDPARDAAPAVLHATARFAGNAAFPPAEASARLSIRSATTLAARVPDPVVLGRTTLVDVAVTDARGLPVASGTVQAYHGERVVGSAPLDAGRGALPVSLPAGGAPGATGLRIVFLGSPSHAPSEAQASTTALAGTRLAVDAAGVRPGELARITIRAFVGDAPLAFAPVTLEVAGLDGGLSATTGKDGTAVFLVPQANATLLLAARTPGTGEAGPALATASLLPVPPTPLAATGARIALWAAAGSALLLGAAGAAAYLLRRHPLTRALTRARLALAGKGPLEHQVLLAYRILEDAAIAHEILDDAALTPRLLQEAIAPTIPAALHPSLDRLVALFEAARYGRAPLRPTDRDAALVALGHLRRQLNRMEPVWRGARARGHAA